jgi:polar amino acid transport system substrate-binding protein
MVNSSTSGRRNTVLWIVVGVVVVIAAGVVAYLLLRPPAEQATDDSWSRVQQAGKMVVGTAADYPPFSYYNSNYQVDGFDVALIREIGQRLGVPVEVNDIAFDGLGGALQINQIDAAIAALSVTPEREAVFDFTYIYFVSEDAILARQDLDVDAVRAVEEMAGLRTGVQKASVYENWLQTELVDTGRMPAENLFVYGQIDQALRDLGEGLLDLVVLDLPPAQAAAEAGGVKLVGQGLNRQSFAIAVPDGADSLRAELNRALNEMKDEGRLSQLVEQYIGLSEDEQLPLPTPGPETPEPEPPAGPCVDGMKWVEDLTYDDKNMTEPPGLGPGQKFQKAWRVLNNGTCSWDNSYRLVYVTGNVPAAEMGGQPLAVDGVVEAGQQVDFRLDLVSPQVPGVYQGFWELKNGQGQSFGDRLYVGIQVLGSAPPAPGPTETPAPGISFSVDRTSIKAGECVVFSWETENVQAVYFYREDQDWTKRGVEGEGSRKVCPSETSTYKLKVIFRDDTQETRKYTITVEPSPEAPIIERFTVDPPTEIPVGGCVDIRWKVTGNVKSVDVLRDGFPLWGDAPVSGTTQDCPQVQGGEVEYALEAAGPGGTSRLVRYVRVGPVAEPYSE